ncbi:hypothetical protein [Pantoea ananatis]|uniref:hypothetical protein n=1 Tax=Pantoea ananas TaxID=553 RepID=UPI0015E88057|nr:hypothetical protein [Pantoea ananatis]MCK0555795.1 hypothetical protein [Pantoea ananatis]MCW0331483.1 hypothetical protein [Pantoea ananatis]
MLTEEQLNHIVTHPDDVSHQVVAMAKELLAYRAAFAQPYAVIEPLGMTYIGDENAAMVWHPKHGDDDDTRLYLKPLIDE